VKMPGRPRPRRAARSNCGLDRAGGSPSLRPEDFPFTSASRSAARTRRPGSHRRPSPWRRRRRA
jgi:hypothetical protein